MIRRELAKDPKLATESWDRFLPQFRKRHLTSAEKSAKKRGEDTQGAAGPSSGANSIAVGGHAAGTATEAVQDTTEGASKKEKKKKVYTPFPPAQLPRKVRDNSNAPSQYTKTCAYRLIYNSKRASISSRHTRRKSASRPSGNKRYAKWSSCPIM